jgi:hypothetical protein
MQTVIEIGSRAHAANVMGVRVLLLSDDRDGRTADRLATGGSLIDFEDCMDHALTRLCNDPMGYDLFVMDCDAYGGFAGGERAVASLIAADARMRVMLVSRDFDAPALPLGRRTAVCLPSEVEDEDFRRGMNHVLRDRVPLTIM